MYDCVHVQTEAQKQDNKSYESEVLDTTSDVQVLPPTILTTYSDTHRRRVINNDVTPLLKVCKYLIQTCTR